LCWFVMGTKVFPRLAPRRHVQTTDSLEGRPTRSDGLVRTIATILKFYRLGMRTLAIALCSPIA
jgi:hypothetical protein